MLKFNPKAIELGALVQRLESVASLMPAYWPAIWKIRVVDTEVATAWLPGSWISGATQLSGVQSRPFTLKALKSHDYCLFACLFCFIPVLGMGPGFLCIRHHVDVTGYTIGGGVSGSVLGHRDRKWWRRADALALWVWHGTRHTNRPTAEGVS